MAQTNDLNIILRVHVFSSLPLEANARDLHLGE